VKKLERRDSAVTSGARITGIISPPTKRRDRSWDQEHTAEVVTYRLTKELKQSIIDLAAELEVGPAELARILLVYGIESYRNGKLKMNTIPKVTKNTLTIT
jgi:hypothetical protein